MMFRESHSGGGRKLCFARPQPSIYTQRWRSHLPEERERERDGSGVLEEEQRTLETSIREKGRWEWRKCGENENGEGETEWMGGERMDGGETEGEFVF